MKEHCENPCCENPGVKEVPVSVRESADEVRTLCAPCEEAYTWGVQHGVMSAVGRLVLSQVDQFLEEQGFVVLARNSTDPSPDGAFEAWAYTGPLDFQAAEPICFGIGTHSFDAVRALDRQVPKSTRPGRPAANQLPLVVTRRELATILAALRFHQTENLHEGDNVADHAIRQIATDNGLLAALASDEVDELCERLNLCPEHVHPGMQRIHDLLYLDMRDGREFHNPDKSPDPDIVAMIAGIVAEYIPRPGESHGPQQ